MSTALMARKPKRDPGTVAIAKAILEQYNCKNVEDMQEGIKDILRLWIGEYHQIHTL